MNLVKTIVYLSLGLLAAAAALQIPLQAQTCDTCEPAAQACQPAPRECTVWVPQIVFENRTITVARYRHETRERMVLVNRDVPVIKNIEEEYTVMVPQTRRVRLKIRSIIRCIATSRCARRTWPRRSRRVNRRAPCAGWSLFRKRRPFMNP